jgi:hypothetical protein
MQLILQLPEVDDGPVLEQQPEPEVQIKKELPAEKRSATKRSLEAEEEEEALDKKRGRQIKEAPAAPPKENTG